MTVQASQPSPPHSTLPDLLGRVVLTTGTMELTASAVNTIARALGFPLSTRISRVGRYTGGLVIPLQRFLHLSDRRTIFIATTAAALAGIYLAKENNTLALPFLLKVFIQLKGPFIGVWSAFASVVINNEAAEETYLTVSRVKEIAIAALQMGVITEGTMVFFELATTLGIHNAVTNQ